MASVGTHIKRLRTARGLTQEELAETLFVTRQAVSAWETGKAQPDVETLERIAAALGAAVTEVIYGTPPPNLGCVKRRWALIGGGTATIIAILLLILVKSGAWGTWREGLRYQLWDQSYGVTLEELPGTYELELDLTDPESNLGKVLYADESGCRITVQGLTPTMNAVIFQAQGACTPAGGQLVSGCYDHRTGKQSYALELTAVMRTSVNGILLPPSHNRLTTSLDKRGNAFGFYLYPLESEPLLSREPPSSGTVTVAVTGLTRLSTRRIS